MWVLSLKLPVFVRWKKWDWNRTAAICKSCQLISSLLIFVFECAVSFMIKFNACCFVLHIFTQLEAIGKSSSLCCISCAWLVLGRAEHQTDAMSLEQLGKVCSLNADPVSSTVNQCPARGGTCGSSGWACGLSLPQGQWRQSFLAFLCLLTSHCVMWRL